MVEHGGSDGGVGTLGTRRPPDTEWLSGLTDREAEVLRLIGCGANNREISQRLWVAESTVKTHLTRIFRNPDLHDRAQAVVMAYETGLIRRGDRD